VRGLAATVLHRDEERGFGVADHAALAEAMRF
jgi:hypothetical protein